ncbi:hypothetical protein [Halomicrobium katesii]|uniref:hypothetical protein n=1 Tax=Halomicrobium katesii TaxID=437163 RepID=UPI0012BAA052|nr:hypothetical protein [Halomicrobium katesii]
MSVAGCLFDQTETGPDFTLHNIRSHLADQETAIVVGRVKKRGDAAGNVSIRAELLIEDEYNHASIQTFVISEDVDGRVIALPFTSDSSFYDEQTFTARAKIIRHGEADGEWVSETA